MYHKAQRYFKFDDGSIDLFDIDYKFVCYKPTHRYSSNMLGFGEWIKL